MFRRQYPLKDRVAALCCSAALLGFAPTNTTAQTLLYWDADGASSSATGGTGNWVDNGTGFRSGSSTGSITGLNNNTSAVAVFEGTAGTVTLGAESNPTVGGISSNSSSYTLALGANTLTINSGFSNTYRGNITGTGGITKTGSGTQTLANNIAYTGDTTINGGTLQIGGFDMTSTDFVLANTSGATLAIPANLASSPYFNFASTVKIGSLSGGGTTGGNVTIGNFMGLAITTDETSTFAGNITGNGILSKAGSATQTFTGSVNGNSFTVSNNSGEAVFGDGATSGSLNVSGGIKAGTNSTIAFNRSDNITLSNAINSNTTGTFEQRGSGKLTLTGTATEGTLSITNGTLAIGNGGTSGSVSSAITNASALEFNRSDASTASGNISGTGTLDKLGAGTLTLSGANTYSGTTTVQGGTLLTSGGNAIGDTSAVVLNNTSGVILDLNDTSEIIGSLAGGGATGGNVTLGSGTLTTGGNNTSTTFSGVISETGDLVKTGTGTFTLAGANTYTGSTTVNNGTLSISADNNLGAAPSSATPGHLTLNGGTLKTTANFTLDADRGLALGANHGSFDIASGTTVDYGAKISGTGNLTKTGAGTLNLNGTSSDFTGDLTISTGTLGLFNGSAIPDSTAVTLDNSTGTLLHLNSTNETIGSLAGGGTTGGDVNLGSGTLTLGGNNSDTIFSGDITGTGSLVKTGTGSISLRGTNTFSGGVEAAGGFINLFSTDAIGSSGTISFTGGALEFQPANTTDYSSRFSTANNQAYRIHTSGNNVTFACNLTSSGGTLTKQGSGTLTLSGTNTFNGATNIEVGTLTLSGGSALADTSAVTLSNTAGTSLSLNASETIGSLAGGGSTGGNVSLGTHRLTVGGDNTSTTFSGQLSGTSGGLTKTGSGTFIMNNSAVDYDGDTIINGGTLQANQAAVPWGSDLVLADTAGAQFVVNFTGSAEQFSGLSGGGANGGNITVNSGGILQPGFNNATSTYDGVISGAGALNKVGNGTLTLTSANTHSGGTTVSAGSLQLNHSTGLADTGAVTVASGATLDLNNTNETIGSLAGAGNVTLGTATLTTGGNNTTTTFSGAFSGTGGLTKAGTGNFTLTQQPGFSGGLALNGGTVTLDSDSDYTAANQIAGSGNLTKTGTGTLTLSGTNSNSGTTTISAGNLRTSSGDAIGNTSAVSIASGASLDLNNVNETVGAISGAGSISMGTADLTTNVGSGDTTFTGAISGTGTLIKSGANTLSLTGNSSFSGGVNILGGGLRVGSGGTTGGGFTGDIAISSGAGLTFDRSDNTTYSSNLTGAGSFTKDGAGKLELRGNNTYSGGTTLAEGTLNLHNANSIGSSGTISFTGGALQFSASNTTDYSARFVSTDNQNYALDTNGQTVTLANNFGSNGGTFTKSGSGTLIVTGDIVNSAGATLSGGNVQIGNGGTSGSLFGAITNNALITYNRSDDRTLSTPITGTGALTQTGSGNLTVSTALAYTGDTTIDAGSTLTITDAGSLAGNVVTNGTLAFTTTNNAFTFANAISGSGGVTLFAGGNFLNLSGTNSYTGDTQVSSGILTLNGGNAIADSGPLVMDGGFLVLNASETIGSLRGSGGIALFSHDLTTGGNNDSTSYASTISGTGKLIKDGTGTFTLTGTSNFTGGVDVLEGSLVVGDGSTNGGGFSGDIAISSGANLSFNRSDDITFSSNLSGAGSFTKDGAGSLELRGTNTYSGGTILAAGTMSLHNANSIGSSGTISFTGGTLQSTAANTTDYSSRFSNAANQAYALDTNGQNITLASNLTSSGGSLTKSGSGTLTLSGTNTFDGATTINAGTLGLSGGSALADTSAVTLANVSGAQLTLNASETIGSLAGGGGTGGNVNLGAHRLTFGGNNASTTYSGQLSGTTGGVTKEGTGTFIMDNSAVNYDGDTIINGGTLQANAAAVPWSSNLVLADTAGAQFVVNFTGSAEQFSGLSGGGSNGGNIVVNSGSILQPGFNNATSTYAGVISGAGAVNKVASGTLTLTGANTHTGGTTITGGTLALGSGGTTGSLSGNLTNNAALSFNRSNTSSHAGIISGTGALTQAGTGTHTLSGANTYSGTTTVSSGTLTAAHNTALGTTAAGTSVASGATLAFTNDISVGAETISLTGTLDNASGANTFAGTTSGTGALSITADSLTLTGDAAHTGGTSVASGTTLNIGNGNTTGSLAGNLANAGAVAFNRSTDLTFSGDISGTGTLTKLNTNTLTLSGTNTHSGDTNVSAGTLRLGTATALSPNSNLIVASGATFDSNGLVQSFDNISGAGNIGLGSGDLTVAPSGSTTFSGNLSGNGGIIKNGTGTLTLSGNNSYAGTTALNTGTLAVSGNNAAGSGTLALNGGTLQATSSSTLGNAVSLNADTTISGGNALNLSGAMTLGGFKSLNITNSAKTTFSGAIGESSTSILIKKGSGELELTGANTFTGGTLISAGTVRINNNSGSAFGTGAVTVSSGATLAGAGSYTGALQLNGTFSPGNSTATTDTGSQTWAGDASFIFEIDNATGGAGSGWDLLNITGTLTINATMANPFTVNVDTLLNGTNTAGAMSNFDADTSYSWTFAQTSGGISYGTNASISASFAIHTDDFANTTNGTFSVAQIGDNLALNYTTSAVPEPASFAALTALFSLGAVTLRRRRRACESELSRHLTLAAPPFARRRLF